MLCSVVFSVVCIGLCSILSSLVCIVLCIRFSSVSCSVVCSFVCKKKMLRARAICTRFEVMLVLFFCINLVIYKTKCLKYAPF